MWATWHAGWLFCSTPGTACSAAAAFAAPVPDASDGQEAHPETSTAEEVPQPPQLVVSVGAEADSGNIPTCPADGESWWINHKEQSSHVPMTKLGLRGHMACPDL